jgi:hypothetical protein
MRVYRIPSRYFLVVCGQDSIPIYVDRGGNVNTETTSQHAGNARSESSDRIGDENTNWPVSAPASQIPQWPDEGSARTSTAPTVRHSISKLVPAFNTCNCSDYMPPHNNNNNNKVEIWKETVVAKFKALAWRK